MSSQSSSAAALKAIRRKVLTQLAGGIVVASIPVMTWFYWARQERERKTKAYEAAVRIPALAASQQDTYDYLISEKCQAGDVLLFDRRWEHCATSPWSALSCIVARYFLTNPKDPYRSIGDEGRFDHIGLIVPGYVRTKADALNPSNLLLLEATPHGIVARPLKERLERSFSRSILLLQLACPGERRNLGPGDDGDNDNETTAPTRLAVERTRQYVERELVNFRDQWVELSKINNYAWIHSTVGLGGALLYGLGMQQYSSGPVSPSAYLVLLGLIKAAAAQNIDDKVNRAIKVEDFLRDYRYVEQNTVQLRPGWRFLPPIAIKETARS